MARPGPREATRGAEPNDSGSPGARPPRRSRRPSRPPRRGWRFPAAPGPRPRSSYQLPEAPPPPEEPPPPENPPEKPPRPDPPDHPPPVGMIQGPPRRVRVIRRGAPPRISRAMMTKRISMTTKAITG